jgi:hypothetical protein
VGLSTTRFSDRGKRQKKQAPPTRRKYIAQRDLMGVSDEVLFLKEHLICIKRYRFQEV